MSTATLERTAISAADYFAAKLAYEMTPWRLKGELDKGSKEYHVLDVRTPDHYNQGRIPGAKNAPLETLASAMAGLPKDKTIVTYCSNITCQLAPKAALMLAREGFRVMELFGGIAEWQGKGFPVEK